MQTIKTLLKKAKKRNADPNNVFLLYNTTALSELGYSPSQLLFDRMLRTKLLVSAAALELEQPSHKVDLVARQIVNVNCTIGSYINSLSLSQVTSCVCVTTMNGSRLQSVVSILYTTIT